MTAQQRNSSRYGRFAFLSARRNDKCANIRTQMALFAFLSAHDRRFGAHLGTQTGHASHRGTGLGQTFC
ncbi:hypothetical protein DW213_07020 [Bifidobacterium bifidum]|nr:hypothetical protein DXC56_07610 [Bifidobacterium bifidum]RGL63008.1 hypothetical protein DXC55_02690 [Bifidobacterium bifidum]RHH16566.1 hypothetical protein DW221_07275 [Bifidobacterium bifidum]RHH27145.1 hypothetical protein DW214_07575 [Bifidobacterium bifidum]RHH28317.1 hypothetical protein DW213_07020 [Bifidobacterium bifidum]